MKNENGPWSYKGPKCVNNVSNRLNCPMTTKVGSRSAWDKKYY